MTDETNQYDLMREAAQQVKAKVSLEKAKSIIKEFGHADLLNQVKPEHYQAVIDQCVFVLGAKKVLDELEAEDELDKPSPINTVEDVVLACAKASEANVAYTCSPGMQDAAIQGLNNLPADATVEQAINAIYNAWSNGGFVKHYD